MTLLDVPIGQKVRIQGLHARPEVSRRLRELGLSEQALISCVMRGHGNIICGIRNMRIGLDHHLAGSILVALEER